MMSSPKPTTIKYGDPPSGWIHGMGMESEGRERIAEFADFL